MHVCHIQRHEGILFLYALLLSWFGNKLSILYILKPIICQLSLTLELPIGSLFFVQLCQIILMYTPNYRTHGLSHQNPVIAHKGLQGAPIILVHPLHYTDNLTTIYVLCFSDSEHNHNEYENAHIRRILRNRHLDATKPTRSIPTDSCSEYDPNDYSELVLSKADCLSCSPIKVPVLIWQGFISCTSLA